MKKILAVLSALAVIISLSACKSKPDGVESGVYDPNVVSQNPTAVKQDDIIAENFGVSIENQRIVGYEGENDYVKYIIIEYDDFGNYRKGQEHFLYHNEDAYKDALHKYGDTVIESDDEALYLSVASGFAGTKYSDDFKKLDDLYYIKTQTGVQ